MRFRSLLVLLVATLSMLGLAPARAAAATAFHVTAQGMSIYVIDNKTNPTLTLTRGQTYDFVVDVGVSMPHPFWITTARGAGDVNANAYSLGVTNNGASPGTVTFTVPASAPATLYYQCAYHDPMGGTLNVVTGNSSPAPATGWWAMAALAFGLLVFGAIGPRRRPAV